MAFEYGELLLPGQKKQLQELVAEYEDITAINFKNLQNSAKGFVHEVDTRAHPAIKQAPYWLNPVFREWVKNQIAELLEEGVIVET